MAEIALLRNTHSSDQSEETASTFEALDFLCQSIDSGVIETGRSLSDLVEKSTLTLQAKEVALNICRSPDLAFSSVEKKLLSDILESK